MSLSPKTIGIAFLLVAGAVYSQKGVKSAPQLSISRVASNESYLMYLEWDSGPSELYTVESGIGLGDWEPIAENLSDPSNEGTIRYDIPDEYAFDTRRFFRVRVQGE